MSHTVRTAIVPYKKPHVYLSPYICDSLVLHTLLEPEEVERGEAYWQVGNKPYDIVLDLNGWKHSRRKFKWAHHELFQGPVWTREGQAVLLLNESEYSNLGYYDVSIVSDSKESIESFVKSFKALLNTRFHIKGPAIGHSWW